VRISRGQRQAFLLVDVDRGDVHDAGLEAVDQRQRVREVGARHAGEHVAGAQRVRCVGQVAVAEAVRLARLAQADRKAGPAGEPRR
jgi:hypothetical protein